MRDGPEDAAGRPAALAGLRVLVAEDRRLIAAQVAMTLRQAGCRVVGPVATVAAGLAFARGAEPLAAAVLDIDLEGELAYPVAAALRDRGVPILFLTGFGALVIPAAWRDTPRLEKPFDAVSLVAALGAAVVAPPAAPGAPARADALPPSPLIRQAWESIRHSRDLITEGRIVAERGGAGKR